MTYKEQCELEQLYKSIISDTVSSVPAEEFKYLEQVAQTDFPYKVYTPEALQSAYKALAKAEKKITNAGLEIVEHYHPSIWRCNIKNHKSPLDGWYDLNIMYKVIKNRLKYLNTDDLSVYNLRSGLSISKLAPKVSIFRPAVAKYLINKYLNEFDTVFDPCSGFSGRLLGTCILGKKYIGQDINSITIRESRQLIKDFNLNAEVKVCDSLYDSGTYDCLFTCPPYGDKEIWHQDVEIYTADEWIDVCLKNYKCKSYLFVVDETEKYKDYIVDEISNKSYFSQKAEKVVLIRRAD